MFGTIGIPEILILLFIALIIFGPKRLPQAMKGVGQGLRELKNGILHRSDEPEDPE